MCPVVISEWTNIYSRSVLYLRLYPVLSSVIITVKPARTNCDRVRGGEAQDKGQQQWQDKVDKQWCQMVIMRWLMVINGDANNVINELVALRWRQSVREQHTRK